MHSNDPEKSDVEFRAEFEHILEQAGEGVADFTGFVFPGSHYGGEFKAECYFGDATFTQSVSFAGTEFRQANFERSRFLQDARFDYCVFGICSEDELKIYARRALADETARKKASELLGAEFLNDIERKGACRDVDLHGARERLSTNLGGADTFADARFGGSAYFRGVRFLRDALFSDARFEGDVNFEATWFRTADFSSAQFCETATFSPDMHWRGGDSPGNPLPGWWTSDVSFAHARLEKPERVTFHMVEMKACLLLGLDVSKVNFSNVSWRLRDDGKRMVLEEAVVRNLMKDFAHRRWAYIKYQLKGGEVPFYAFQVKRDVGRSTDYYVKHPPIALVARSQRGGIFKPHYRIVAELYQQLKKNYENRGDYSTAGDFHYGEMEMRRLDSAGKEWFKHTASWTAVGRSTILWWMRRNLGLLALYKYASRYGESYVRPGWLLLLVLFAFALLYPLAGLRDDTERGVTPPTMDSSIPQAKTVNLDYSHPPNGGGDERPLWRSQLTLVGYGAITAAGVALFLRDLPYEPIGPWGTLLRVMEVLLTSTLGALFLLAVRRHVRR
jgi:uncharacterized protein YjbI with pentapeptide repeats